MRDLAGAVGDLPARTPADMTDPGIPVAATVVLARDTVGGPEVLLIERPDRGSFAGAWVFPGGKLEDDDRIDPAEEEVDAARRAGVRETREESGLHLDPAGLLTVSVWDPPPGIPLRIRTWFFATRAPEGELALQADEAVAAAWVRPRDLLARHGRGEVTLYPPTWVTLHGLADQSDVDAMLAEVRFAGVRRFETIARRGPSGPVLLWSEDAEYADAGAPGSARHRLEVGGLPWRYTRSD